LGNGSGFFVAFQTPSNVADPNKFTHDVNNSNDLLDPPSQVLVETTEEAVVNALVDTTPWTGREIIRVEGASHDRFARNYETLPLIVHRGWYLF